MRVTDRDWCLGELPEMTAGDAAQLGWAREDELRSMSAVLPEEAGLRRAEEVLWQIRGGVG